MQIRLGALMWMHRHNFVNRVRRAKLVSGIWRHDAHATVAALLLGGNTEPIKAYLDASVSHMKSQGDCAVDTGLKAISGVKTGFSPQYYLDNCTPLTLTLMAMASENGEKVRLANAIRTIVEDGTRRFFDRELGSTKEAIAAQKLAEFLRPGPYTRTAENGESWTVMLVEKADSDLWNEAKSKTVPYVVIRHVTPARKASKVCEISPNAMVVKTQDAVSGT